MGKKKISRNDYMSLCRKLVSEGKLLPKTDEYDIIDLDFTGYHLNSETENIVNIYAIEETTDRNGDYMLEGRWSENFAYEFGLRCDFSVEIISSYSSYGYSDKQMAVFTYCEGDFYFTPYKDKETYEKNKKETIEFYKKLA